MDVIDLHDPQRVKRRPDDVKILFYIGLTIKSFVNQEVEPSVALVNGK